MEEIKLFIEIGNIKSEIERDLGRIREISNVLDLRNIYSNNKLLSNQIYILNQNFTNKMDGLKNQNTQLQKELLRAENAKGNKESQIENISKQLDEMQKQRDNMEIMLNEEKEKNRKIRKEINNTNDMNYLLEENKKYINSLY